MTVIQFPDTRRAQVFADRLRIHVVDCLAALKRFEGEAVVEKAAADVMVATAAILAHAAGTERLAETLVAIAGCDRVTALATASFFAILPGALARLTVTLL
jgi:hypothetical protein